MRSWGRWRTRQPGRGASATGEHLHAGRPQRAKHPRARAGERQREIRSVGSWRSICARACLHVKSLYKHRRAVKGAGKPPHASTYRRILAAKGDRSPNRETLRQIAECFGETLDQAFPESDADYKAQINGRTYRVQDRAHRRAKAERSAQRVSSESSRSATRSSIRAILSAELEPPTRTRERAAPGRRRSHEPDR